MFCCLSMWCALHIHGLVPNPQVCLLLLLHLLSPPPIRPMSMMVGVTIYFIVLYKLYSNTLFYIQSPNSILLVCSRHHFSCVCAAPCLCSVGWHHWSTNGPGIQKEEEGVYVVSERKKHLCDLTLLTHYLACSFVHLRLYSICLELINYVHYD